MSKRTSEEHSHDFSNVMINLSNLSKQIDKYIATCNCDNEIGDKIKEIDSMIPRIFVWGDQSCGKSSVLNRMFNLQNEYKLCTGSNVTTLCLIELKCGPNYEGKNIYIDFTNGERLTFDNITDAQAHIKKVNTDNGVVQSYNTITVEINHTDSMIITDVPGCATGQDEYNSTMAKYLFGKPNATILHIIRSDIDPVTEISSKYLNNHENIITVLTHIDKSDDKPYIKQHVKNSKKIAITNNQKNEENINNDICKKMSIDKNSVINGANQLGFYCSDALKSKVKNLFGAIENLIAQANNMFDRHLERIGYISPDPRDVCHVFRTCMSEFLKNQLLTNVNFEKYIHDLKINVSQKELFNIKMNVVPPIDKIQEELKYSNRSARTIKGTEGCETIVRKYIKNIMNNVMHKITDYVDKYFVGLSDNVRYIITDGSDNHVKYTEYTKDYVKKIVSKTDHEKEKLVKTLLEELNNELNEIENLADTEDANKVSYENRDHVREIVKLSIDFYVSTNRSKTYDEIVNHVLSQMKNDTNQFLAERINSLIHGYWELKSRHICDRISEKVSKYEKTFENIINKEIMMIESTDVSEPKELHEKRILLTQMKKSCELFFHETSNCKKRKVFVF